MLTSVFKELNHQTKHVVNITSMYNNKTFTRDANIENIFNKHFTSVAEKYLNDTANKSHSPNLLLLKEFFKQKLKQFVWNSYQNLTKKGYRHRQNISKDPTPFFSCNCKAYNKLLQPAYTH